MCLSDLQLSTTPLTNDCHNDGIIQLGPLHSQSLFQFIQISDACFVHLLFSVIVNGSAAKVSGSSWRDVNRCVDATAARPTVGR